MPVPRCVLLQAVAAMSGQKETDGASSPAGAPAADGQTPDEVDRSVREPQAYPFPKSKQLHRGPRRYRRKVASPKQWQAIWDAKRGPCRACSFRAPAAIDPHHLVFREDGGDDVPDNIVPLCRKCHEALHVHRAPAIARLLLTRLSDAEYAYMVERGGEDYAERVYGVEYAR